MISMPGSGSLVALVVGGLLVFRLARREVVDVGNILADRILVVVQAERAAGELGRDRTSWTVGILLRLLRAGSLRRLRVGTEVTGPRRLRRRWIEARSAESAARA